MIILDGNHLELADLLAIADDRVRVGLAPDARARVAAARAVVDAKADGEAAVYGVNTGFGNFAETRIDKADLARLQLTLLRSHAAGVDTPLPVRAVRASMALRANVLAKGYSGIRVETLEALLALLNRGLHPRVPSRGSVGASGDLAPLAHLALVLAGLQPVTLGPKEGLALINGTQFSTAVLALALAGAERLVRTTDIAAA